MTMPQYTLKDRFGTTREIFHSDQDPKDEEGVIALLRRRARDHGLKNARLEVKTSRGWQKFRA